MFGQNPEKMIIVVAPDKYKMVAREMTHELSKLEDCNVAFWTIKQFEDNEMTIGSKHWILSIGNSKENKLTADYLNFINLMHTDGGLCNGYDANKAIIYADANKIDKKNTIEVAKKLGLISDTGAARGAVSSTLTAGESFLLYFFPKILLPTIIVTRYFQSKQRQKELLKASTSLAADLFLKDYVKNWLNIELKDESK